MDTRASVWWVSLFTALLVPIHPTLSQQQAMFTREELFEAFRLILPAPEAREAATTLGEPTAEEVIRLGAGEFIVRGRTWTDDTLILLSLLSDELRERVEQYRARNGGEGEPEKGDAWMKRRAELQEIIESRRSG